MCRVTGTTEPLDVEASRPDLSRSTSYVEFLKRVRELAQNGPETQRAIDEGRLEEFPPHQQQLRELDADIAREQAREVERAVARAKRPSPTTVTARRERSRVRPREHRATRRRATRAGPSSDDDSEPAASPFQAAHRVLLRLTARELDTLADIAARRALVLRAGRWAA